MDKSEQVAMYGNVNTGLPPVNTSTHCRRCRSQLIYDEKRGCKYCPVCHPPSTVEPVELVKKKKLIDVQLTEERVREIVRDELADWHIQKPSVTVSEAKTLIIDDDIPKTGWRAEAKELGIDVYDKERKRPRKKVDVLEDIERAKNGGSSGTENEPKSNRSGQ
jgi:uncharacterized Zn finger protein (UPF0148 family)